MGGELGGVLREGFGVAAHVENFWWSEGEEVLDDVLAESFSWRVEEDDVGIGPCVGPLVVPVAGFSCALLLEVSIMV